MSAYGDPHPVAEFQNFFWIFFRQFIEIPYSIQYNSPVTVPGKVLACLAFVPILVDKSAVLHPSRGEPVNIPAFAYRLSFLSAGEHINAGLLPRSHLDDPQLPSSSCLERHCA